MLNKTKTPAFNGGWLACEVAEYLWDECPVGSNYTQGETYLQAAMRCYVASKLGNVVEIPDELV